TEPYADRRMIDATDSDRGRVDVHHRFFPFRLFRHFDVGLLRLHQRRPLFDPVGVGGTETFPKHHFTANSERITKMAVKRPLRNLPARLGGRRVIFAEKPATVLLFRFGAGAAYPDLAAFLYLVDAKNDVDFGFGTGNFLNLGVHVAA